MQMLKPERVAAVVRSDGHEAAYDAFDWLSESCEADECARVRGRLVREA
jgi:hypothetical protein